MPEERDATLLAVATRGGVAPKDRVGRLQDRPIIVVAQAAQIFADVAERTPNEKIGGDMVGRVAAIATDRA